jgi:urease subunit alpha
VTTIVPRSTYHTLYGPTTGDTVALGDTGLSIEVERSEILAGEEVLIGAGRNLRDGLSIAPRTARDSALDMLINSVLVVDAVLGIVKADIGIKHDRIIGIGQAGNPDTQSGVDMIVDSQTQIVPGAGLIATPGAIDTHVHLNNVAQAELFCRHGYTTLIGASLGPAFDVGIGSRYNYETFLDAVAAYPLNVAMLGRACSTPSEMEAHLDVGCSGFKIHEDLGAFAAVIDAALSVSDSHDIQTIIHTDTINESVTLAETLEAIGGRTIHAYHVEGTGGGHAPDILEICGQPHVLPSSTNPTNPFTQAALREHLDMIMACHLQHRSLFEDLAFAQSRIRPTTMAAEDVLHDMGAISMMGSDSNGMGRAAESVRRSWQLAAKMKKVGEAGDGHDNDRVLRYLEKYTLCPALAHGIADHVGSLTPGRLADVVLWDPRFFGVKPSLVVKSGIISFALAGPANGSYLMTEPLTMRPQWGATGGGPRGLAKVFTSRLGLEAAVRRRASYHDRLLAVHGTRGLNKRDLSRNAAIPLVRVDPDSLVVTIDGAEAISPPTTNVPLSRRYLLV